MFSEGDLVRVVRPLACGGLPLGAVGLVLEKEATIAIPPRYTVMWFDNNEVFPGMPMKESVTYGHGLEVISESR